MVDTDLEVENILREIRLRVQNENAAMTINAPFEAYKKSESVLNPQIETDAALKRLKTHLATTNQMQSNLPPVRSYRQGWLARIELWFKQQIKRAASWFVFDQLNFNSAVHQSLDELYKIHTVQAQMLARLDQQAKALSDATESWREDARRFTVIIEANSKQYEEVLIMEIAKLQDRGQAQIEQIQSEVRERASYLMDQQKTIYKNLTLQISESSIITDRLRRNFEHRLTELEKD